MSAASSITSGLLAPGTTTVINRKTRLNGFIAISDGTNLMSVVIYDNASAGSGTIVAQAAANASQPTTTQSWDNPVKVDNGLTVVVTGTGAGAVIYYDA